jgi:hypothetical protein
MKPKNYSNKEIEQNLYPMADAEVMIKLWKKIITMDDVSEIYRLYKKYVNPQAVPPVNNCNCSLSPSRYYEELRDWYGQNNQLFK